MEQTSVPEKIGIIIEDGKLIPPCCECQTAPWRQTLEALYARFHAEDRRNPPKGIIPFDNERIVRILATNGKKLSDEGFISHGMATLILANHGTGARYVGHSEDVFVDPESRGRGIGKKLMLTLIAEAEKRGALSLWLTSNPRRIAAHRLYEELGFMKAAQSPLDYAGITNLYLLPIRPA